MPMVVVDRTHHCRAQKVVQQDSFVRHYLQFNYMLQINCLGSKLGIISVRYTNNTTALSLHHSSTSGFVCIPRPSSLISSIHRYAQRINQLPISTLHTTVEIYTTRPTLWGGCPFASTTNNTTTPILHHPTVSSSSSVFATSTPYTNNNTAQSLDHDPLVLLVGPPHRLPS